MNTSPPATPPQLPITLAHALDQRPATHTWLVEHLWGDEAVGILGGEPKCCKSLFALHLALAVASGEPLLQRYAVPRPGGVLFFAAEDAEHIVGDRIRRIAQGAGVDLSALPLAFITAPALRLDDERDLDALDATVQAQRPRLLVLDPFVRLHRRDENNAGDIAPLLAALRALQRRHHTAVLVVHHARKGGGSRAGQALRGSSEFHAWGDCNLFLRWRDKQLVLTVEHRAAPAIDDLALTLRQDDDSLQFHRIGNDDDTAPTAHTPPPEQRLLTCLRSADGPLTRARLREHIGIRNATLGRLLDQLCTSGHIQRHADGYRCTNQAAT